MRILIMEHLTSAPGRSIPEHLIAEGRAMRDAVLGDLLAIRGTQIVLFGHREHAVRSRPRLHQVESGPHRNARFRSLVRAANAVLVIAPEGDGLLARFCRIVEEEGRLLLGPSAAVVRLATDKWRLHEILRAAGLATPTTTLLRRDRAAAVLRRRPRPFVLKPRDGFGGLGVTIVRRADRIQPALEAVVSATRRGDLLVQEFVPGEPASVSVLVGCNEGTGVIRAVPLGLNHQHLTGTGRPIYTGGESGWSHPMSGAAILAAVDAVKALARSVSGCRGYLGVDLMIGPAGPVILEINPRITTSYIGIRQVIGRNPAALILDACQARTLPSAIAILGRSRFKSGGAVRTIREGGDRSRGVSPCRSTAAGTSAASI